MVPARCGAFADERRDGCGCVRTRNDRPAPEVRLRGCHKAGTRRIARLFTSGDSSPPSAALRPARCGAFADERRVVAWRRGRTGAEAKRSSPPTARGSADCHESGTATARPGGLSGSKQSWHREESQDLAHDAIALIGLEKKLSVRGTIQNDQFLRLRSFFVLRTNARKPWAVVVGVIAGDDE
jgi:hypothetical protein